MNQLELAARRDWKVRATLSYFGKCDVCGRTHDEEGEQLLVCRQPMLRIRECFDCWARRTNA